MYDTNNEKKLALGLNPSTARYQLIKKLLFHAYGELEKLTCFKCGEKIETLGEFTIEHKTPWLRSDNPTETFFDLNNIACSHHTCNSVSVPRIIGPDGTAWCSDCKRFLDKSLFSRQTSRWSGVYNKCKKCRSLERQGRPTE